MKKILLMLALGGALLCSTVACSDDNKNPGDFTIKSELTISDIVSTIDGKTLPVSIVREIDTVFQHEYTKTDTVTGRIDTLYYGSKFTSRYYEADVVWLASEADTFNIDITTNAKWEAPTPVPTSGSQWLYIESGNTGGGDSNIIFRVGRNRNASRAGISNLQIYTSDSTVMYNIPIRQRGERDAQ